MANCHDCKHLEFIEDQSFEIQDGGWCCNKREYKSEREESRHLSMLDSERYRTRTKSCAEKKDGGK